MKKLIILATLLAVSASQAAVLTWIGDSLGGSADAADGQSWSADGGATAAGVAPSSADTHALVTSSHTTLMPTISADFIGAGATAPGTFGIGWDATTAQLTIANGGSYNAGGVVISSGTGDGTLVIEAGGTFYAGGYLVLSQTGVGAGNVDMTGGVLWTPALVVNNGNINMADGAVFAHAGDTTGNAWENSVVLATGAGESIVSNFDGTNTNYTVIPEPATFGLVAAFGGAILFLRKKIMI